MENHSSVTGHQGSRLLKRVWMGEVGGGGGGAPPSTNVSCQLGLGLGCQLNDY